jgi:hypothetical protein
MTANGKTQTEPTSFGIDGVEVETGDHVCCFYSGAKQRDDILHAYLRAGLRAGDKCICLIDSAEPDSLRQDLAEDGTTEQAPDQLDIQSAAEAYLEDGRFSSDHMIGFLEETMNAALNGGHYSAARAAGEMSWVLKEPPGSDELFAYESAINGFVRRYPQLLLCMYDLDLFGGGMIVEAIKTHPKVLVGGQISENPWYVSPA